MQEESSKSRRRDTRSNNIWTYNYSGSPSTQWRERTSSIASSICGSGTGFGQPMDTDWLMRKQDCTRYDEQFAAMLASREQALGVLHTLKTCLRSQKLANICRDIMTGLAERAVRREKQGTSTLFVQWGFDERWWERSYDTWLLFTKHSRFISGWKNTFWKKVRHSIPWAHNTFWSTDISSSNFHKRHKSFITSSQWYLHCKKPWARRRLDRRPARCRCRRHEDPHHLWSTRRKMQREKSENSKQWENTSHFLVLSFQ